MIRKGYSIFHLTTISKIPTALQLFQGQYLSEGERSEGAGVGVYQQEMYQKGVRRTLDHNQTSGNVPIVRIIIDYISVRLFEK
jgi:hypothetical protein